VPSANFLDFGTGWDRIARFFVLDFDFNGFLCSSRAVPAPAASALSLPIYAF
jgi:hypothetical protein